MQRVLAVEDEGLLLQSIVAAVASLPAVEVLGVSEIGAALRHIDERVPDLLITDLSLPDGNGLQLIERLERLGHHHIPVIVQTGQLTHYREGLAEHPRLLILEKPFSIRELRSLVAIQLGNERDGKNADPFGVIDYLQLAGFSRRSLLLGVRLADDRSGQIQIVDGDAWQARLGELVGVPAIEAMITTKIATIEVDELPARPTSRSIGVPTHVLLLELARLQDEADEHQRRDDDAPQPRSELFDDPFAGLMDPSRPHPTAVPQQSERMLVLCEALTHLAQGRLRAARDALARSSVAQSGLLGRLLAEAEHG